MEYFRDILIYKEQEEVDTEEALIEGPILKIVKEIINKSRNTKALEKYGIHFELIEYGGERIIRCIYKLVKQMYREKNATGC